MKKQLAKLSRILGYEFKNEKLLVSALTHRSVGGRNNERLEFLGDSILNFVMAEILFKRCPKTSEGGLSRHRANLVNGDMLAVIAQEFDLGTYIQLGPGELKSGGTRRKSILADAVEAIIGAIYLDSDFSTCRKLIETWYGDKIEVAIKRPTPKDPKTRLQEYLQAHKHELPDYEVISIEGAAHNQTFNVKCTVAGLKFTTLGIGQSRRKAEQHSAKQFLEMLLGEEPS